MDTGHTNVPMSLNDLILYIHSSYRLSFFLDFEVFSVKFQKIVKNTLTVFFVFGIVFNAIMKFG
jgi:hypothetical protein